MPIAAKSCRLASGWHGGPYQHFGDIYTFVGGIRTPFLQPAFKSVGIVYRVSYCV